MIEQFVALYPRGRITYQQTDFLELTTDIEVHRIKFIGKANTRIKRGTYGELAYFTEHPALFNYNHPIGSITIRVKEGLPPDFLKDYACCLHKWRGDWRHFASWTGLSFDSQDRLAHTPPRYPYQHLCLPYFIAEEVILLCQQHGVEANRTGPLISLPNPLPPPLRFGILCIGSSYAIANDFYVSTLR
ncbi:hypothetical protein [Hymenobacter arcticus]